MPRESAIAAVYLITLQGPSGACETSEFEAEQYFTHGDRVTFWSSSQLGLPEPVAQFERAAISEIVKRPESRRAATARFLREQKGPELGRACGQMRLRFP